MPRAQNVPPTISKILNTRTRIILTGEDFVLMSFCRVIGMTMGMGIVTTKEEQHAMCVKSCKHPHSECVLHLPKAQVNSSNKS